ncbi:MAG: pilus assembly protein TadG-related protein [Planctomycetota bacterium]
MNRRKRTEGGVVLVMFVLMSFAFLSMAALVIDVGHTILARSQMQAAAESAALDGLSNGAADPALTDIGRAEAALTVARHFGEHDGIEYSAGPNIEFEDGIELDGTRFRASQLIDAETIGPYEPTPLQLNLPNLAFGDMVVGQYFDRIDGERTQHVEHSNYTRDDFEPESLLPAPTTDSALLVRMRRTGNLNIDGISSSGPYVPFLFGRGGLMSVEDTGDQAPNPGALADRRFRGTAVRATAIASLEPAMHLDTMTPADVSSFANRHFSNGIVPFIAAHCGQPAADLVATRGIRIQGLGPISLLDDRIPAAGQTWEVTALADPLTGRLDAGGSELGYFVQSTVTRSALNSDEIGDVSVSSDLPLSILLDERPFIARIGREAVLAEIVEGETRSLNILQRDLWQEFYQGESEADRVNRNTHPEGSRLDVLGSIGTGMPLARIRSNLNSPFSRDFDPGVGPLELMYAPVYTRLPGGIGPISNAGVITGFVPILVDLEFNVSANRVQARIWVLPLGLSVPTNASTNIESTTVAHLRNWALETLGLEDSPAFGSIFDDLVGWMMNQRDENPRPVMVPVLRRAIR